MQAFQFMSKLHSNQIANLINCNYEKYLWKQEHPGQKILLRTLEVMSK